MAFTEFCCRSGGSNLNAGTRTGNSTEPGTGADFTYASGNWVQSTGVFTVASGDPSSDGVAVGDFASVYADGSTVTGFVGRVTARDATTITVSLTAKAGTAPTDGTGDRTLKIGGAWKGPNGSEDFPFDLATLHTLTNASSDSPRINMKNDAQYDITASITPSTPTATVYIQGYTSSYADLGRAIIDGGTAGASYILFGVASPWWFFDLTFQNNGASGTTGNTSNGHFVRCVSGPSRGPGFSGSGFRIECEAFSCNAGNASGNAGMTSNNAIHIRCISHDNTGSNSVGFLETGGTGVYINCIADTNGADGFGVATSGTQLWMVNCDSYNNTRDGFRSQRNGVTNIHAQNSNFVKNGGYGVNVSGSGLHYGYLINCAFGAGTQANSSGQTNAIGMIQNLGAVTYANDVTPWVDPANGDFRINLAAAKAAGRGAFLQTAASYAGTVAYPDIGAAQHQDSGSGGLIRHPGMAGGLNA